jgi:omega-hydroxy-beta-dihydromenaquinone-9 sulfotransferase
VTREVFVVGNSRTGTHLIAQLLGSGSQCFMLWELHFWERMAESVTVVSDEAAVELFATLISVQRDGVFAKVRPRAYLEEAEMALSRLPRPTTNVAVYSAFLHHECRLAGRGIPVEKTPRNLFYVKEIAQAFPEARFIAMQRDPRDVLLSQRAKWLMRWRGYSNIPYLEALRSWANYHPAIISSLWRASANEIRRLESELGPSRFRIIRFEDLVADARGVLVDVCDWLDLPFEPPMLEISRLGSSHESRDATARGVNPSAADRWRQGGLGAVDTWFCQRICGEQMTVFGYELQRQPRFVPAIFLSLIGLPLRVGLSFMMNVTRARSVRNSVRRRVAAMTATKR